MRNLRSNTSRLEHPTVLASVKPGDMVLSPQMQADLRNIFLRERYHRSIRAFVLGEPRSYGLGRPYESS